MKFDIIEKYLPILLQGALSTIELSFIAILCGIILAFIIVLMKIGKIKFLNAIGTFYTWFFRGIPLMILLFMIYFGLPQIGINMTSFTAAIIGLSINISAYVAEAIRGAILSVNKNQWEAAQIDGMNFYETVFFIIIPQSLDRMLPAVANEFIALIKDTALVSTIAMTDLMNNAQRMANVSFRPLEIFLTASVIYLMITTFFTVTFKFFEKKLDFKEA